MKTNKSVQSGLALFISILSLISISYTTVRILRNSGSGTDMQQNQSSSLTHSDFRDVKEQISPVCQDTVISRDYVIRNLGNDTLNVLFVSPDCNCTGYKLSSPAVLPGDSIILSMDIDMHHKRIGKFMINTILALNTEKRLYRIKIEGEVSTFHDMPSGREDRLIPEPNEENTAQAGQTEASLSASRLFAALQPMFMHDYTVASVTGDNLQENLRLTLRPAP